METFVSSKSKIYIIANDGSLRKPEIDEVEFHESHKFKCSLKFEGAITDERITKCRCNNDEIILEKTKDDVLKIFKAYNADPKLYRVFLQLAVQGNYSLEIGNCENISDMYHLDKVVDSYSKTF